MKIKPTIQDGRFLKFAAGVLIFASVIAIFKAGFVTGQYLATIF